MGGGRGREEGCGCEGVFVIQRRLSDAEFCVWVG